MWGYNTFLILSSILFSILFISFCNIFFRKIYIDICAYFHVSKHLKVLVEDGIPKEDCLKLVAKAGFKVQVVEEGTVISSRQYDRLSAASLKLKAWK